MTLTLERQVKGTDTLKVAPLFDLSVDKPKESLWDSNVNGLLDLQSTNHPKMNGYYKQMRLDFWNPYNFAASDYVKLQEHGRVREIERVLSYLSFLDSLQVRVIPEFARFVTDPSAKLTLAEHASMEAMHVLSYEYMISNFPLESREYIRTGVQTDPLLRERCSHITEPYQRYLDNPTAENLMLAYFADYLIEGFLFQNGFNFFYQNVASLADSVIIIKLISRDEETHKRIFQYLLKQAFNDPFFKGVSKQMLLDYAGKATEIENQWCKEIFTGDISDEELELHNAWRMNTMTASIGIDKLDTSLSNPLKHLYGLGFEGDGSTSRSNVLEIKSANYSNADMLEFEF